MTDTPAPTANAVVVGLTDVGRVREHNEDCFLVMNRTDGRRGANGERFEVKLDGALLLVVCDGMGGAAAGEIASRMAADRMAAELGKADFTNASPDQITSLMDHAVQQANLDIHEAAKANPSQKGMGTTMTAAVVTPTQLFVSQVGDSRAYLLRKGLLNQITKDQSLIGQLIEEGTLTEEEAEKLGGRNIVLQAVGVEENLRVDTKNWDVLRGDVILVCSDGLSGMVKDARMKEILLDAGEDMGKAATNLIAEANQNGGRDNVTSILARFGGEGLRAPMEAADADVLKKAGVAFKAPPPPDVPNPMRRMGWVGLVLLAAIAALFFVLKRTTAVVEIATLPAGVAVHVVLTSPDGTRKYEADSKDGKVRFEGVVPADGAFTGVASVKGGEYDEDNFTIPVAKEEDVTTPRKAWPIPHAGRITVTPNVARVEIHVETPGAPGRHHPSVDPYDQTYNLEGAVVSSELSNIPAGEVTVTARREGFQDWTETRTLPPAGAIAFAPKLTEIKGDVVVECADDGAAVVVFDDKGEVLDQDHVRDGAAKLKVRKGRQSLKVTKVGFTDFVDDELIVTENAVTRRSVKLTVVTIPVTLLGHKNAEFKIYLLLNSGPKLVAEGGTSAGTSRAIFLEPGNYQIRWQEGTEEQEPIPLEIRAGVVQLPVSLTPKKK